MSIPVAFFPVRDVIPVIEVEPVIVIDDQTVTVLATTIESVGAVSSGSTSRDEYFQIRVLSPDPDGDDLAPPTRLPDDIISGDKLQRLFESLPDGRYAIQYVLGDGNVRSILTVDLRDGKPTLPGDDIEAGPLRLRPIDDFDDEFDPEDSIQTDDEEGLLKELLQSSEYSSVPTDEVPLVSSDQVTDMPNAEFIPKLSVAGRLKATWVKPEGTTQTIAETEGND